jgi:hypothetical protein
MKDHAEYMLRYNVEASECWREWCEKVPFIRFPAEWDVKVIPPFAGAIARFIVRLPDGETRSVYLDVYNRLGFYSNPPEPYWEVYPYQGDVGRCDMADVAELIRMIGDSTPEPQPTVTGGE